VTIRSVAAHAGAVALALLLAAFLAACGSPGGTFSPAGACVTDGGAPGAYPELEALAPRTLDGKAASAVNSGRNCTPLALGTLAEHGVTEMRFGGATWDLGGGAGESIGVIALPDRPLPLAWAEEFYLAGALNGTKTDNVKTSHPSVPGTADAFRIDALNDLSQQAVVLWQVGGVVRVVVVATPVGPNASMADHEAKVTTAIAAAVGAAPPGSPSPSPVVSPS
jgi:hypothetical protein